MSQQGTPVASTAAAEPFSEVVQSGELVLGGHASKELREFAMTLCKSYDSAFNSASALIETAALSAEALPPKYQQLVRNSKELAAVDRLKRVQKFANAQANEWNVVKYNAPFKIESHSWKEKTRQERSEQITDMNTDPVIYESPLQRLDQVYWTRPKDFQPEYEPNAVNLFRVVLEPNTTDGKEPDEQEESKLGAEDLS